MNNKNEYLKYKDSLSPFDEDIICQGKDCEDEYFHTSVDAYVNSHKTFNGKISDGSWRNFSDYLAFYNNLDVEIILDGFANFCSTFIDEYDLSPVNFLSLPSIALRLGFSSNNFSNVLSVMMSQRNEDCYSIFSFGGKFDYFNPEYRKNLKGGLTQGWLLQ